MAYIVVGIFYIKCTCLSRAYLTIFYKLHRLLPFIKSFVSSACRSILGHQDCLLRLRPNISSIEGLDVILKKASYLIFPLLSQPPSCLPTPGGPKSTYLENSSLSHIIKEPYLPNMLLTDDILSWSTYAYLLAYLFLSKPYGRVDETTNYTILYAGRLKRYA